MGTEEQNTSEEGLLTLKEAVENFLSEKKGLGQDWVEGKKQNPVPGCNLQVLNIFQWNNYS